MDKYKAIVVTMIFKLISRLFVHKPIFILHEMRADRQ